MAGVSASLPRDPGFPASGRASREMIPGVVVGRETISVTHQSFAANPQNANPASEPWERLSACARVVNLKFHHLDATRAVAT
jgi:hypothetical protein